MFISLTLLICNLCKNSRGLSSNPSSYRHVAVTRMPAVLAERFPCRIFGYRTACFKDFRNDKSQGSAVQLSQSLAHTVGRVWGGGSR